MRGKGQYFSDLEFKEILAAEKVETIRQNKIVKLKEIINTLTKEKGKDRNFQKGDSLIFNIKFRFEFV